MHMTDGAVDRCAEGGTSQCRPQVARAWAKPGGEQRAEIDSADAGRAGTKQASALRSHQYLSRAGKFG
jgi:hypothetical protein